MKKNTHTKKSSEEEIYSPSYHSEEFDIFKSRVASAALDYMESHSDPELIDGLEKASQFFINISKQIENAFDPIRDAPSNQDNVFEIGEDLLLSNEIISSHLVH